MSSIKQKLKNYTATIITIILILIAILWGLKVAVLEYEEVESYSIVCNVYMLTNEGEIGKKIFTNDDWSSANTIKASDGKVYNLSKFHYYKCEYIRPIEANVDTDLNNLTVQ